MNFWKSPNKNRGVLSPSLGSFIYLENGWDYEKWIQILIKITFMARCLIQNEPNQWRQRGVDEWLTSSFYWFETRNKRYTDRNRERMPLNSFTWNCYVATVGLPTEPIFFFACLNTIFLFVRIWFLYIFEDWTIFQESHGNADFKTKTNLH